MTRSFTRGAALSAVTAALLFPALAGLANPASAATPATISATTSAGSAASAPAATKPSTAAKKLFRAWQHNDRTAARKVATSAVVKKLFRVKFDPTGVSYFYQGCSKEPQGYACAYSYEGGAMTFHVRGTKAHGYLVKFITYIAD